MFSKFQYEIIDHTSNVIHSIAKNNCLVSFLSFFFRVFHKLVKFSKYGIFFHTEDCEQQIFPVWTYMNDQGIF